MGLRQHRVPADSSTDVGFTALWGLLALAVLLIVYGTLIPTIVFFAMWLHRVVRNMPALGSSDWRTSPGWSVGLSFVPIANLLFPYLPILDAWRASDSRARWLDRAARKAMGVPLLLVGWWTLWVLAFAASRAAFVLERYGDTSLKIAGSLFDIANAIFLIGAAVLAIFVIRDLTRRQDEKNELSATGRLI